MFLLGGGGGNAFYSGAEAGRRQRYKKEIGVNRIYTEKALPTFMQIVPR